ncbi:MAG: hypothetical protein SOH80_09695 [Eubacteriales bacterium]|jgi:hypothetical protein
MCGFPKDPTGGLFDFNKDGKLDAAEYTMMNDVIYHDSDEDSDDSDDSEFDDTDDADDEEDADEEDND